MRVLEVIAWTLMILVMGVALVSEGFISAWIVPGETIIIIALLLFGCWVVIKAINTKKGMKWNKRWQIVFSFLPVLIILIAMSFNTINGTSDFSFNSGFLIILIIYFIYTATKPYIRNDN
ncbi:hypothetical protein RYX56_19870 [Alkalihalophilus lindianensis]|uniref:Uncharacterized protein n=1 Tax=Alkalihalophilus lindianensis TaxID=1630542 RepID=A0ABU3XFE9_9BACI|nr:hypothetical protein [Alkalihalophilus lindianensis]MDV2686620.1 hypothetical protein [Alkalihalophilus lindianensis]